MAFKLTIVSAALAGFIASTTFAQVPANCDRTYQVVENDTCDLISAAQNVSTYQLAHVNANVINPLCTNLFIGETICLGITGQDCNTTHIVVTGDSCNAITAAANIDLATLLANNPNVVGACTNIYPGQVLCVAPDVIPYTN